MDDSFIYKCMMTNSTCYKRSCPMDNIYGIMFNCTESGSPYLLRYVQPDSSDANYNSVLQKIGNNRMGTDYNHRDTNSGFTFYIGRFADGTIGTVQSMPINYSGWGSGSSTIGRSANDGWIQCLILKDSTSDADYWATVIYEMVRLSAYICVHFGLDPTGFVSKGTCKIPTILSRNEAYYLNYAYNLDNAPFTIYASMDDIRERVVRFIETGDSVQITNFRDSVTAFPDFNNESIRTLASQLQDDARIYVDRNAVLDVLVDFIGKDVPNETMIQIIRHVNSLPFTIIKDGRCIDEDSVMPKL